MFRENKKYQVNLFGIVYQLPVGVKKMLDESWSPAFRKLVFDKIDEKRYAELYSDIPSRPNFPVNVWVGLEIVKYFFDYTDEELMHQWHFNLLTAYALGQEGLGELTLCIRTVYYNRERLLEYEARTGRNLLEEEFKSITGDALKQLGVDTGTQRMDSSFVGSFIKKMSRLEIAVKVLQNFYKELPELEQKRWQPLLSDYLEEEAQHLSFRLKRSEVEAQAGPRLQEEVSLKGSGRRNGEPIQATDAQWEGEGQGLREGAECDISMAIGINFGRIWAYLEEKKRDIARPLTLLTVLFVTLEVIFIRKWLRKTLMDQRLAQETVW